MELRVSGARSASRTEPPKANVGAAFFVVPAVGPLRFDEAVPLVEPACAVVLLEAPELQRDVSGLGVGEKRRPDAAPERAGRNVEMFDPARFVREEAR